VIPVGRRFKRGIAGLREQGITDSDSPLGRSLDSGLDNIKKVYLALVGAIVLSSGYRIYRETKKLSSETIEELPYSNVVVDNAMERTRANEMLNHDFGGVPNPRPTELLRLITGTPPYIPLSEDLI
jgi:hypothetical protein